MKNWGENAGLHVSQGDLELLTLCDGYSWLPIWLYLEWSTVQKHKSKYIYFYLAILSNEKEQWKALVYMDIKRQVPILSDCLEALLVSFIMSLRSLKKI